MKKFKIVGLLLIVVVMSTLLEGCFRKGENDPFISFRSRQARMSGNWTITEFKGDYLEKLNSGENRKIILKQNGNSISETISYIGMSAETQDSLQAGQDTTIEWKGKIIEAMYDIREDGTFDFAYEYTLEKTHGKAYDEGYNYTIPTYKYNPDYPLYTPSNPPADFKYFFPPYPGVAFKVDSTMKRNYRREYRGRWNFLDDVDGYLYRERVIFEVESSTYLTNYSVTYILDADDDDGRWDDGDPVDTTFSSQSLESTSHKYANGEFSILWELDKLRNLEITMMRELDHIFTHALTGDAGYKHTKKGNELVEMEQDE